MPKSKSKKFIKTVTKSNFFKSSSEAHLRAISYKNPSLEEKITQFIEANFEKFFSQANMSDIEFSDEQKKDLKKRLKNILPTQYSLLEKANHKQHDIQQEDIFYDLAINELEEIINYYEKSNSFPNYNKMGTNELKNLQEILLAELQRDEEFLVEALNKLSVKNS